MKLSVIKLSLIFFVYAVTSLSAHAELPKQVQIDMEQANVLNALKKDKVDCNSFLSHADKLEKLAGKLPAQIYYYRADCKYQTGNYASAKSNLDSYFASNKVKGDLYQKALILYPKVEKASKSQNEQNLKTQKFNEFADLLIGALDGKSWVKNESHIHSKFSMSVNLKRESNKPSAIYVFQIRTITEPNGKYLQETSTSFLIRLNEIQKWDVNDSSIKIYSTYSAGMYGSTPTNSISIGEIGTVAFASHEINNIANKARELLQVIKPQ